jgi:hypothetical protein
MDKAARAVDAVNALHGDFVLTPVLRSSVQVHRNGTRGSGTWMLGMVDIMPDRISFSRVKRLEERVLR